MSMHLGPLFNPFEIHNLKLRNRVAMAPMTRNFSPGNVPSPEVVDYYRRRAEGESSGSQWISKRAVFPRR